MIDAILVDWIRMGALPVYRLGEPGQRFYQFREDRHWHETATFRNGTTWISIEVDCVFSDFEGLIRTWLAALDGLVEVAGTLVFAIRTCCEFDGTRFILAAMAFTPRPVPEAVPLDGGDPADILIQVCGGLAGEDSTTLHPAIRTALARELAYREEYEVERLAQNEADEAAEARARTLLVSFLKPDQRAEFRETGAFHVQLADGRRFRFSKGFGHNVHLVENGVCTIQYCIITTEFVPLYDQMLAQKVLLEVQPDEFFRIANFRALPQPTHNPAPPLGAELANRLAQL